jgi:dTDP-4-dehydrorhamnose 3,5-epimerase-like enzyme
MGSTSEPLALQHCRYIEIPRIVDAADGVITVAEGSRHVPFEIKRVYTIHSLNFRRSIRGRHAHKRLEQVLFCVNGSVVLDLDDGAARQSVRLCEPQIGVYLGPLLWHVMRRFSHRCVLLVLASDYFQESDYIRDYDEFIRLVRARP